MCYPCKNIHPDKHLKPKPLNRGGSRKVELWVQGLGFRVLNPKP